MSFLCSINNSGANAEVLKHFTDLDALTQKYEVISADFIDKLGTFAIPNLSYSVALPSVFNYVIEKPGALPEFALIDTTGPGDAPTPPDWISAKEVTLDPYPDTAPSVPNPNFTGTAPTPYTPSFPAQPVMKSVVDPTFGDRTQSIVAPTPRNIVLTPAPFIDWDAIDTSVVLPTFTATPPDPNDFSFTPDAYVTQILQDVKPIIESMLAGNTGIPAAVEAAIWQRAAERESALAFRADNEAVAQYASQGFTRPGGSLDAARARIAQDAQDKKSSLSRDVMVEKFKEEIQIIQFAVAQGIAYENVFVQIFSTVQNLRLESSKYALNAALSIFGAYVSKFQVDAQLVTVQLDAKKAQIQIEIGKLQGFEAYLRGQELIGRLNQQDVELYNSRLNAVLTDAKIYETEVTAAHLVLDENEQLLKQAQLFINEELAKLQAKELEVRIFGEETTREATKQQAWATRAQTFATEMGAWATAQNVKIENMRLVVSQNQELSSRYAANIEGFKAKAEVVRTLGSLIVSSNESKVQAYSAKTQGTSAYNSTLVEQMRGLLAGFQANVELAIKNGEINIQNSLEGKRLEEQALATATSSSVQVLASALSGHSTSASISDSSGVSGSCSYNTSQVIDS